MAKKSPAGPFRIAFGSEDFLIDRFLDKGRNWKDRHVLELDGFATEDYELVDACTTAAFDGAGRVIIIDHAERVKGPALVEYIAEVSATDDSLVVIAACRQERLPKHWKQAAAKGLAVSFPKFKPWETDKQVGRIKAEAKLLGITLDAGVAELLLKVLGDDLRGIANELAKLVYLVKDDEPVSREHVAKVVAKVFPVEPWDVAEVAAAKNAKKAMTLLALLFKHLGEGVCVPVTFSLMKTVERLIIARQLLDQGEPVDLIATRLGMHAYAFKMSLLPLVKKHTVTKLRGEMARLCTLETLVKGPARSKRTHVELAVLSLAA